MNSNPAMTAAFLNRLALGAMFLSHGLLKIFVFTLPGTASFFESMGFPAWTAYAVTFAEVAGGAALILGLRSRIASAALLPVLLGATFAHWGNGWVFSAPNGGWEYPAFLAVSTLVQILLGDGRFALAPERHATSSPHYATEAA